MGDVLNVVYPRKTLKSMCHNLHDHSLMFIEIFMSSYVSCVLTTGVVVTAILYEPRREICTFVSAYAKSRFSHEATHILSVSLKHKCQRKC